MAKKAFYVTYKVTGEYVTKVEAESVEKALKEAEENYYSANFCELQNIDGKAVIVEDEEGNFVWEK